MKSSKAVMRENNKTGPGREGPNGSPGGGPKGSWKVGPIETWREGPIESRKGGGKGSLRGGRMGWLNEGQLGWLKESQKLRVALGVVCLTTLVTLALPTEIYSQNPVLEEYIREGLRSNQALKQKQLDYARSLAALKGAAGLFFPDLSVNARYTVAEGGRIIEFPVGDLLNPVYSTLNLLTGSEAFPQVENQEFPFYRPREQETKLSLVQPLFSADIVSNYRIQKQYSEISRVGVDRYQRELVREITKAYYAYQKAENLLWLADTSYHLVEENNRVSRRLFENDKVTIDAVYRSEAEMSQVEVQRAQASNMKAASQAYFNFLLNRPLDEEIETVRTDPAPLGLSLEEASEMALENRVELRQVRQYQMLNEYVADLHRGKNIPGVYGVVDYGFQGEEYRFTGEDDFLLASLVLRWNLFQGTVNRQKVKESVIEGEKLEALYDETSQQIRMEVINTFYAVQAAREAVRSAGAQTRSARRAYELISRKYSEGQSPLLELIDARTSLTRAAANSIIAQAEYFSQLADFEYAVGRSVQEYENAGDISGQENEGAGAISGLEQEYEYAGDLSGLEKE